MWLTGMAHIITIRMQVLEAITSKLENQLRVLMN